MGGRDWEDSLICAMVLSRCVLGAARTIWSFHGFIGDKVCQFVETPSTNAQSPRQHFGTSNCLESILSPTFCCIEIRTCYKCSQCTDETLCDLGVPEWHNRTSQSLLPLDAQTGLLCSSPGQILYLLAH